MASVAQLLGHHPANWKATGSIPSTCTCLGCRFGPQLGYMQEATNQYFFLTSLFLSLSLSLPSPLSRINKIWANNLKVCLIHLKYLITICMSRLPVGNRWQKDKQNHFFCWLILSYMIFFLFRNIFLLIIVAE